MTLITVVKRSAARVVCILMDIISAREVNIAVATLLTTEL